MSSPNPTGDVLEVAVYSEGLFAQYKKEKSRSASEQSPEERRKVKSDELARKNVNISPERQRKHAEDAIKSTKIVHIKLSDKRSSESELTSGSSTATQEDLFNKEMVKPNQNELEVQATALELERERKFENFTKAYANTMALARKQFKDRISIDAKEKEELYQSLRLLEDLSAKMRADLDEDQIHNISFFQGIDPKVYPNVNLNALNLQLQELVIDLGSSKRDKRRFLETVFSFLKVEKDHKKAIKNAFSEEVKGKNKDFRHATFLKSQLRFHIIHNYSLVIETICCRLKGKEAHLERYNAQTAQKSDKPFSGLDNESRGIQPAITPAVFNDKKINRFCESIKALIGKDAFPLKTVIYEIQVHYVQKVLRPLLVSMARQVLVDHEAWKNDSRLMYRSVTKFWADRFANTMDPEVLNDAHRAILSGSICALDPHGELLVPPYVNDWHYRKEAAEKAIYDWLSKGSGECKREQFSDEELFLLLEKEVNEQFGMLDNATIEQQRAILQRRRNIKKFQLALKRNPQQKKEFTGQLKDLSSKLIDKWLNDYSNIIQESQFDHDSKFCQKLKGELQTRFPLPQGLSEKQENSILERRLNIKNYQSLIKNNDSLLEALKFKIIEKLENLHHKPKLKAYVLKWQDEFGKQLLGDGEMMIELCRLQNELANIGQPKPDPDETLLDEQRRIMGLIMKKAQDPEEFGNFITQLTLSLGKWKIKDYVIRKLIKQENVVFNDPKLMEEFHKKAFSIDEEELSEERINIITEAIFNWVKDENKMDRILRYPVMKIIQALTYMYGVSRQKNTEGLTTVFIDAWGLLFPLDRKAIEELPWKTSERKRIEVVFNNDINTAFMKRFKISSHVDTDQFYLFTQVLNYTRPHLGSSVEPFVTAELSYQTPNQLPKEIRQELDKKTDRLKLILEAQLFPKLKVANLQKK